MITIGLIDDHDLFRSSLRALLSTQKEFSVAVEADNGDVFFYKMASQFAVPDIVITDYQMPKMNGKAVVEKLKEKYPSVKTIVLSVFEHEHLIKDLIHSGAFGFLSKSIRSNFIFQAIHEVMQGKIVVSNGNNLQQLSIAEKNKFQSSFIPLTDRQVEFLKLCALPDLTYKEIADYMNISPKTADRYRDELFKKLDVNSRAGLLLYAVETGLCKVN